ncbi:MAG: cell division protein FtsW [Clostridia bacterium]|nr:cell division protein FtsW [Clostridia bacterium]
MQNSTVNNTRHTAGSRSQGSVGMANYIYRMLKDKGGFWAKGSFDVTLFILIAVALVFGLVMLYSASYPDGYSATGDPAYYFKKQLVGVVLGVAAMLLISKVNYKMFMEIGAIGGSLVSLGLLVVVLFAGENEDGSSIKRWLKVGGIEFQPSDIAKLTLILTLAYILHIFHSKVVSKKPLEFAAAQKINALAGRPVLNESAIVVFICAFVILAYVGLVLVGSHLSGAIIMMGIAVCVLYTGEVRLTWFVLGIALGIVAVIFAYFTGIIKPYQIQRILSFVGDNEDPLGADWQTNQALYAIGSGGFFGKGLGQSVQKYDYVPEPQNDMIYSILVEELGFVGGVAVIILFALIIWRGTVIGINSTTRYGAMVAFGITFKLAMQVALNIGVATDFIPNTGITLPFFSYGRTALVVNLVEIGILMSISRSSRIKKV